MTKMKVTCFHIKTPSLCVVFDFFCSHRGTVVLKGQFSGFLQAVRTLLEIISPNLFITNYIGTFLNLHKSVLASRIPRVTQEQASSCSS